MLSYIISQFILTTRLGRRSRRSEHWIPTPACAGAPQLVPESGLKAGHWPGILVPSSPRGSSRGPHRPGPRPPGSPGLLPSKTPFRTEQPRRLGQTGLKSRQPSAHNSCNLCALKSIFTDTQTSFAPSHQQLMIACSPACTLGGWLVCSATVDQLLLGHTSKPL